MNFFLQQVLTSLLVYKYWALFLVSFLDGFAIPVPAGAALMASAAFASQGYLNIWWVILAAAGGNIAADILAYWLALKFGHPVLKRIGLRKVLESPTFTWLEAKVEKYRKTVVFFSRFNVITDIAVNIIAGLSRMPFRVFLWIVIVGEILGAALYASIGYFFGDSWQIIDNIFGRFSLLIVAVVLLFLVILSRNIQKRYIKTARK